MVFVIMTGIISLSDYYNKLIQVQMGHHVVKTLHDEVFHHLNNGAATLVGYMRRFPERKEKFKDVVPVSRAINQEISADILTIMNRLEDDRTRMPEMPFLMDLMTAIPGLNREDYDALCAGRDRLDTYAEGLSEIRKDAEIMMLERSGFLEGPLDLERQYDGIPLREIYNKATQVQLGVKTIAAHRTDIVEHMTRGAARIKNHIRTYDDDNGTRLAAFNAAEPGIVADITGRVLEITAPVSMDTKDLNVAGLRLVTLINEPTSVTQSNYDALCAFNDRLGTAAARMFSLRKEAELSLMRAGGIVSERFKIS